MGAEVTVVERDVIGGAAHLWDCIPSKTMIATGGAISFSNRLDGMGLESQSSEVDVSGLTNRIESIKDKMRDNNTDILESQGRTYLARDRPVYRAKQPRGRRRRWHADRRIRRSADLDRIEAARS